MGVVGYVFRKNGGYGGLYCVDGKLVMVFLGFFSWRNDVSVGG